MMQSQNRCLFCARKIIETKCFFLFGQAEKKEFFYGMLRRRAYTQVNEFAYFNGELRAKF